MHLKERSICTAAEHKQAQRPIVPSERHDEHRCKVTGRNLAVSGTLLLLLDDLSAQAAATPITPLGKFDSQVTPTPQGATTILTRISPSNKSIGEKDGQNVELTSGTPHDGEDGARDRVDPDESQSEGRSDAPVSHHETHASFQASSSAEEEIESADGSRKAKYGEISAESSGKSTSTKAVAERPLRLSRTNELTVATTKSALNDSKQDNKKNSENGTLEESPDHEGISAKSVPPSTKEKLIDDMLNTSNRENSEFKQDINVEETSKNPTLSQKLFVHSDDKKNLTTDTEEIMTVAPTEDSSSTSPKSTNEEQTAKFEKSDKANKSDHKEAVPKLDSRKDKNSTLANFTDRKDVEDWQSESHDRELTTMRGVQHEDVSESREDALDPATRASEAFDLEKTDGKKHDGAVSLINDTYVNYKTQTEKDPRANTGDQAADVDGSRGKGDPKKEVEIVENVTHQPILKIIDTNNTAVNHSHANKLGNGQTGVVYKRGKVTVAEDKDREEQKVFNASIKDADDGTGERKSIDKAESQVRSLETTTLSAQPEEQTTSRVIPSPIPQGRTIELSDVNEFPSVEVKSTTTTRIDTIFGTAPAVQSTKMITPKPYPYVESVRSLEMTTKTTSPRPRNSSSGDVAEETSAYENTISREESGKKLIVTEASVVLENSIQQQKSDEKGLSEGPANFTTESSSAALTTVMPIMDEIRPTNETFPDKSNSGVKSAGKKDSRTRESDDASATRSGEEAVASRDEDHDVTGNGITEVSLPEDDGKEVMPRPVKATTPLKARSTETPITPRVLSPGTDIQTQPEEAMMNLSTIVVDSTIVPLDTATGANQSTISSTPPASKGIMSTPAAATIEHTKLTLKATLQPLANHSGEAASTTLNPDESSMPTTTSIEFEFVGLTDAISSNATEKSVAGRTFKEQTVPMRITTPLTTPDSSSAKNSSAEEASTMTAKLEDFTELPTTSEHEIPTTEPISLTAVNDTDKVLPTVTGLPVQEQSTEFMRNEVTTSAIDSTGAVTEIGILDVTVTDEPSASKNSSLDANITLTAAPGATELPSKPIVTVPPDVVKNIMKSPSAPPASTSTLEPEVLGNTPNSSESPEEDVTSDIQTFQDEITLLAKIVIEGSPQEICPRMLELKSALAMMLTSGMNK